MKYLKILQLIIVFFFVYLSTTICSSVTPYPETNPDKELLTLIKEYKEFRIKRNNNPGLWIKELDNWDSPFHEVLVKLGTFLGKSNYKKEDIINFLGEPDAMYKPGDKKFYPHFSNQEKKYKLDREEHLIYFWRGWHDYLYFVCQDGVVKYSDWYFAYE